MQNFHADPADHTLVGRRVDPGKRGAGRYWVYYSRGTNSNVSIERVQLMLSLELVPLL